MNVLFVMFEADLPKSGYAGLHTNLQFDKFAITATSVNKYNNFR